SLLKRADGRVVAWPPLVVASARSRADDVWVNGSFESGLPFDARRFLDQVEWQSLSGNLTLVGLVGLVGIDRDGVLWMWRWSLDSAAYGAPLQISPDHDWAAAVFEYNTIVALKRDGTLWRRGFSGAFPRWERLSRHSDWLGIGSVNGGAQALAKDGSLWHWQLWPSFLGPSRKPVRVGSVLDPP